CVAETARFPAWKASDARTRVADPGGKSDAFQLSELRREVPDRGREGRGEDRSHEVPQVWRRDPGALAARRRRSRAGLLGLGVVGARDERATAHQGPVGAAGIPGGPRAGTARIPGGPLRGAA